MENAYQQLKCEIKGHNYSPFTYICMSESCSQRNKLLCTKCAIEHGHSDSYVLLDEILKKDNYSIENWPQDENGKKIKNILIWNKSEYAKQQIENMFDEFQQSLINKIQEMKKSLLQQFRFQADNMKEETGQTQHYFENAYSLKDVKSKLIQFIQEDIDKPDMEDIINQYIKDPERLLARDQAKRASLSLIPNCRYFIDKESFQQVIEKEFYEKIHVLKSCFTGGYHPLNWKLQNSQLYQSANIKEINPGITYQSQCENGEEVLFSSDSFSKGQHGFRFRFDQVSENYRCHVLVGLYDRIKQKDDFKPYLCLMCCDHKLCMSSKKNRDFNIHSGSVVEVKANFDNNLFEIREIIADGSEGACFASTIKTIDKNAVKKQKFFIFFSSSGHHKISLLSSY